MKKLFFSMALLATVSLSAQTMAFTAIEIKVKDFTQTDIEEAFDKVFEGVKMNQGGVILERIWMGGTKGMTHRLVWMYTLGVDMVDEGAITPDKNDAFWAKMNNYIEEWGPGTSGRILSWQEGNTEKNPSVHIWDLKVQDQNQFKKGHDNIIKLFKDDFAGRAVGFGTYDIAKPNGATHWVVVSGEDRNDHLMFVDKLQKSDKFMKMIQERGAVEDVRDFEIEILSRKQ
jgi:hypothetical protein|tara:strand:- start:287 stop:973 length:687 start_codon:yes stop_codon:yes gene_type:complete